MRVLLSIISLFVISNVAQAALAEGWTFPEFKKPFQVSLDSASELVQLKINLQTTKEYEEIHRRSVIATEVTLPENGSPGKIELLVESLTEMKCRGEGGPFLTALGAHTTTTTVAVKPGTYILNVNGLDLAKVEVTETEATGTLTPHSSQTN